MIENISTIIICAASGVLFFIWFRSACLLILVAKPPRDYARGIEIANQLAFREVQQALRSATVADFRSVRSALDRDFRIVCYLLEHTSARHTSAVERGMLRLDYRTMGAWYSANSRISPRRARRALQEMALVVAHFAGTLGEQLATARALPGDAASHL